MLAHAPSVRVLAAIALSLAALPARAENAPAAPPAPRCTLPGAGDWREYTTAHFVVSTDIERGRAPMLVQQLEELHGLVVQALFGEPVDIPGRVHVVAFSSPRRYEQFTPGPARTFGYAFADEGESWILFPYEGREPPGWAVAHELAHAISWHQFPRQPPWFREGLAQFLDSVGQLRNDTRAPELGSHLVRGDRQSFGRWAGFASPVTLERARNSTAVGAKELLEWRGKIDESDPGRFHAASWVLYHWLWNQRSKQLTAYQERLANGEDPATAWTAAFPELDPKDPGAMSRLDLQLAAYRREARYLAYRVEPGKVDATFVERAIPSAELHLLFARIRHSGTYAERREARRADDAEAFREDPLLPAAVAARAREEGKPVAAALAPVTQARPKDPWGWYLLAGALDPAVEPKEKESALRTAVALAPDVARMNDALARVLVSSGRAKEARGFAEHALDLAPWDPVAVDTLAAVAFSLGQCKPALALQRRAAELFAAGDPSGDGYRKRLAEYEAKCAAVAPAAAPAR